MAKFTSFQRRCRLCSSTNNLVWLFEDDITVNMAHVVKVTCGVKISRTDTITQMICSICFRTTLQMYRFRIRSIKNDKYLMVKCAEYKIAQLTNAQNPKSEPHLKITERAPVVAGTSSKTNTPQTLPAKYKFAHPSVKEVVKQNPRIKLPSSCLKSHVGAYITIFSDEVDEYFKERNMTDAEIAKLKAEAYELAVDPRERKRRQDDKEESLFSSSSGKRVGLSTDSSHKMGKGKENLRHFLNEAPKTNKCAIIRFGSIKLRVVPEFDPAKKSSSKSILESLPNSAARKKPVAREETTVQYLQTIPTMYRFAHSSVKEVIKKNPNIKLPTSCLKSHVDPYITLITNEVDEYFKERNMTDSEIAKLKAEAYEFAVDPRNPKKRIKTSEDDKQESPFTSRSCGKRVRLSTDSSDSTSVSSDDVLLPGNENHTNNETLVLFSSIYSRPITELDPSKKSVSKSKADRHISDSFLEDLLNPSAQKNTSVREEITLKSLLSGQGKVTHLRLVDDDERNMTDGEFAEDYELTADTRTLKKHRKRSPDEQGESPVFFKGGGKIVRLNTDSSDKMRVGTDNVKLPGKENLKNILNTTPKVNSTLIRTKTPMKLQMDTPVPKTPNDNGFEPNKDYFRLVDDANNNDVNGPPFLGLSPTPNDKEPSPPKSLKENETKESKENGFKMSGKRDQTTTLEGHGPVISFRDDDDAPLVTHFDREMYMFTTRPFLNEVTVDGESVVISDSEQETKEENDDASRGFTASEHSEADKIAFIEALGLVPKGSQGRGNQPDLSFVHIANKTYKLYTCRVCDSQHTSRKELRYHERKIHTRCPFCGKRFPSLAKRQVHICTVNHSRVQLKRPKLALVRVEEIEEIRMKYARAFDGFGEYANEEDEETALLNGANEERSGEESKDRREKEDARARSVAITELEDLLDHSEPIPAKDTAVVAKIPRKPAVMSEDVIWISDEEREKSRNPSPAPGIQGASQDKHDELQINMQDDELLNNVDVHGNDVDVLKALLIENYDRLMKENTTDEIMMILQENPLVNGNPDRLKMLKNLLKLLSECKIPIEERYNATV